MSRFGISIRKEMFASSAQCIGTVAALWRYPVKGMQGEPVDCLLLDASGVAADRRYAIRSSGAPLGKRLLSGGERAAMLRFRATARHGEVRVTTPEGETYAIDDARLLHSMAQELPGGNSLSLVASDFPQTDVRPVALLGTKTVQQLAHELNASIDARRFRANILLELRQPFDEDACTGHLLRCGGAATLRILERTPRCRMVTLHPETSMPNPALMKHLDRHHAGRMGVYAAVVHAGTLRTGDPVSLV